MGKPSKGTPKDHRLRENMAPPFKAKPKPKPKKGGK